MKMYKILIEPMNEEQKVIWDEYSRTWHNKPNGAGPSPVVLITNARPKSGGYGRWKAPAKNLHSL